MYKTIVVLPDGTEISSGVGVVPNVRHCKINDLANDGEDLNPGSICSACAELTIFSPGGNPIAAGSQFTLYKEDDAGVRHKIGLFNAEKPTRASANVYKVTAYDNVSKLDKDLTGWLATLGWVNYPDEYDPLDPKGAYSIQVFAGMVFEACGLTWAGGDIPNGKFEVVNLDGTEATGRQLMRWICEIAGRRCRATADGDVELVPYTDKTANIVIGPTGSDYYLGGTLHYEDYEVAAIDGITYRQNAQRVVMAGTNRYPIQDSNVIWANYIGSGIAYVNDEDENLIAQLAIVGAYTSCKVAIPARVDIHSGDIITIVTPEGGRLRVPVMELTWDGQCMTLEATGSMNRSSSSAVYS